MGNVLVSPGKVFYEKPDKKVHVFQRISGFSIHDKTEREENDDESGRKRKRLKKGPSEIKLGSLDVHTISKVKQHDCEKSNRIGCYTSKYNFKTKERKYLPKNMLGLKCLRRIRPNDKFDVFKGFVDKVSWNIMDHSLNAILQWITENKRVLCESNKGKKTSIKDISVDFVCMRSVLADMMQIPYFNMERKKVWGIGAVKFGKTIYIISLTPDQELPGKNYQKMTYSGQKFSEYVTNPVTRYTSEGLKDAICYDFCCVYLNSSLKHNVLYAGKIDCIDRSTIDRDLKEMEFKELKIIKVPDSSELTVNRILSQRARGIWIKAALSDIDRLVMGLREKDHVQYVGKIREISTKYIPLLNKHWSPHHCINSLNDILDKIQEIVKEESVYHRIYFDDPYTLTLVRTEDTIDTILPSWFMKEERPQI